MMQTLFTWWRGRSPREQRLFLGLAAIAAIMFAWLAIVRPLAGAVESTQHRHAGLAAELQDVRALAAEIDRASKPRAPRDGRPVNAVVAASAAAAGLEFSSAQPDEKGGVLVSIAAVKPIFLFGWIAALERDNGVVADRIAVRRNDDATVSAEVGFAGRAS